MVQLRIDKTRRYIFIVGGVLLFLGLVYRLFPFLQGLQAAGEEIALKERKIAKYRQMVHQAKGLDAELISLNRILDRAESGLLTGDTPALAAVDIQNILNEIAGRSDVVIKTVRVLKTGELDEGDYLSVPVRFTITSTIRQLKEILYRIETSSKYLTVQTIRITVPRGKGPEKIQSDLTVVGVMKSAEG
ncbi:MAG: type II secretion system protein GspM [Thermodesulfobacteriota bacterium]|nr:type II secretion system protein GspM [Thermodesulfobacteriota bacterium]